MKMRQRVILGIISILIFVGLITNGKADPIEVKSGTITFFCPASGDIPFDTKVKQGDTVRIWIEFISEDWTSLRFWLYGDGESLQSMSMYDNDTDVWAKGYIITLDRNWGKESYAVRLATVSSTCEGTYKFTYTLKIYVVDAEQEPAIFGYSLILLLIASSIGLTYIYNKVKRSNDIDH